MKKVLITGGNGFIGSAVRRVLKEEYKIKTLDLSDGQDITNPAVFEGLEADHVVHLASSPRGPRDQLLETNIVGTENVLKFCKNHGAQMIYASSCAVYSPSEDALNEDSQLYIDSSNAESKIKGEGLCEQYAPRTKGVVVLRIFNPYGPGQGEGFLIPRILNQLDDPEISLLGSPNSRRDFIYVEDLAEAIKASLGLEGYHILNIGSGESHRVGDVAKKLAPEKKIVFGDEALKGNKFCADISRAKKVLGWKPKTSLDEGLEKTKESFLSSLEARV